MLRYLPLLIGGKKSVYLISSTAKPIITGESDMFKKINIVTALSFDEQIWIFIVLLSEDIELIK